MKRISSLFFALCIGVALMGCGGGETATSEPSETPPAEDTNGAEESEAGSETEESAEESTE